MKNRPTLGVLLSILGAALIGCASTSSDGLECGGGTIEEDGVCVAGDASSSTGSASDTGATASDSVGGSSGVTAGGVAGDDETPYAACPGASDVECLPFEYCRDDLGLCAALCYGDKECPEPAGGTAIQRCERVGSSTGVCVVYCGADGFECPSGMACREMSLCDPGGGGTTGGWGTGELCENPTLEICVWE